MSSFPIAYAMKKKSPKKMADGGETDIDRLMHPIKTITEAFSGPAYPSTADLTAAGQGVKKAEGGDVEHHDMIDRIMKKRGCYSEGGAIANQEHGKNDNDLADFDPNEFDDLVLRGKDFDSGKADYTGENSGDYDDNEREDMDQHDIISRIMRSRRLKDRNPRPA